MKKLLTLFTLLLSNSFTHGQESGTASKSKFISDQLLTQQYHDIGFYKPTGFKQRLIGLKYNQYHSIPANQKDDSTYYYYSTERGSTFNHATLNYNINRYDISAPLAEGIYRFPYNPESLNFDSAFHLSNNNMTEKWYITYGEHNNRKEVKYDINGDEFNYRLNYENTKITNIEYFSNMPAYNRIRNITYSENSEKIIGDTILLFNSDNQVFYPSLKWKYTYDNNGYVRLLDYGYTTSSNVVERFIITYYDDNRVKSIKSINPGGNATVLRLYDSFTYTGASTVFAERYTKEYDDFFGSFIKYTVNVKHFNNQGLTDTIRYYKFNSETSDTNRLYQFDVYEYNEYNNPVKSFTYLVDTDTTLFSKQLYYYDEYETDIPTIASENNLLQLYPNPVNNDLNISWKGNGSKKANLNITDISGKLVLNSSINLQTGNQNRVSVAHLPQGVYMVAINLNNGEVYSQKMVKQ